MAMGGKGFTYNILIFGFEYGSDATLRNNTDEDRPE